MAESRGSSGSTKLAVFPVPVCAPARRSPPCSTAGIGCIWMELGVVWPCPVTVRTSTSDRPSDENDMLNRREGARPVVCLHAADHSQTKGYWGE